MHIIVIDTPELGDRSYVVHAQGHALVIDPQRDLDRVEAALRDADARAELVLETHVHNDYVTGGYELAHRTGARYAVSADETVDFTRTAVQDGEHLTVGPLRVGVVSTPGHTDTHLAYVVTDTSDPDAPPAVFTGGSLLFGSVGRTDLVDVARTVELTHAQYHSAKRLADMLPDETRVFPTHGFGSFCSVGSAVGGADSTIGTEKIRNDALTASDEDSFVANLIAHLTAYPSYYAHMDPLNRLGPAVPDLVTPQPVDAVELTRRVTAGEWVIDLRDRVAYASDHLAGTVSIALGTQFATYVGWLVPWGAPLTLIAETPEQVAEAQRQLLRIGIDELTYADENNLYAPAGQHQRRAYPRVTFVDVARTKPDDEIVLDVRRDDEQTSGFVDGSLHIPLTELLSRLDELPPTRLWVHCASGYRASIGASLLDRAGRDVVLIDDNFGHAAAAGLSVTSSKTR